MPRCELTGKGPVVKNLVSHSNIKTKSIAQPNVQQKRVYSRVLKKLVSLRVATSTLRAMEHSGGFDKFILNQPTHQLSKRALELRSLIANHIAREKSQARSAGGGSKAARSEGEGAGR